MYLLFLNFVFFNLEQIEFSVIPKVISFQFSSACPTVEYCVKLKTKISHVTY